MCEHVVHVGADLLVSRQKTEIRVEPGGTRMVVAGAQMQVAAQRVFATFVVFQLAPDDERHLGVGLVSNHAVDHMRADLLQFCGPVQIGFLIETRHQLNNDGDFLATLGRINQRFHDDRVGAGAINGLLDGHHQRVARGLLDELNDWRKALKRMVQKNVLLLQGIKNVTAFGDLLQHLGQPRHKRSEL